MDVDVAVIGGGAVGLAAGRELAERGRHVAVIERHGGWGLETSSHNSGVIHAGIYYPTGSLKHEL
ncbi:MAG TPA: FAD-dependent oxidoreductase, partial [Dehalococcoidia bacterium]|nr:FAD-dependent oxidoreductase [Dehalococcoidia bacterium]